jgi:murein DD-endopeptidase MepM/ murein hydrolase activator NlpD
MRVLRSHSCVVSIALGALLALSGVHPARANILGQIRDSISSLWSQKSTKQQKARGAYSRASQFKGQAEALHDRLEAAQRALQTSNEYYFNTARQLKSTQARIVRQRQRVYLITQRYNTRRILFGRRLAAMQRTGKLSYLQMFLGSRTLSDLQRRAQLFETVTAYDSKLQTSLRADKEELERAKNQLDAQWHRRHALQQSAQRERSRVIFAQRRQMALYEELQNSKSAQLAYAMAQEQSSRELESTIGQLESRRAEIIAQYEAQAAQERAMRRARFRASREYSPNEPRRYRRRRVARRVRRIRYVRNQNTGELKPMSIDALEYRDEMVPEDSAGGDQLSEHFQGDGHDHSDDRWGMPVQARVSSRFGMRFHPILRRRKLHTGEDLAAGYGTPFRAAHGGRVLWSGWKKAYGNTIIVDDGNGTTSLYGHASKLGVRAGQPVKRGEYIGNVGSTGYSTGPHLHFEVRKNGKPVDPAPYLKGAQ